MTQHDQLHRYLFENYAVRGELVTVSESWQQIMEKLLVIAVNHGQRHGTIALKLHGDISVKFQRGGQQAGGNQQLTKNFFNRLPNGKKWRWHAK